MNQAEDESNLAAMERHAQQRARRFWTWMAFLPGLLAPLGFFLWIGAMMDASYAHGRSDRTMIVMVVYASLALAWNISCAVKLTALSEKPDLSTGCGTTFLLILGNTALGAALIWGTCAAMG